MPQGTIKQLNLDKGFGFLTSEEGSADVFFHKSATAGRWDQLELGQAVRFEYDDAADKPRARRVFVDGHDRPQHNGGDRPRRSSDRPARNGDRPARNGDRPARSGDRPARNGDRPARSGDRPARSGDRPVRSGDRPRPSREARGAAGRSPHTRSASPPRSTARPESRGGADSTPSTGNQLAGRGGASRPAELGERRPGGSAAPDRGRGISRGARSGERNSQSRSPRGPRPAAPTYFGFVTKIFRASRHGFISPTTGGPELLFEAHRVTGDKRFFELEPGEYVRYAVVAEPMDPRQPEATGVMAVERRISLPEKKLPRHPKARRRKPTWRRSSDAAPTDVDALDVSANDSQTMDEQAMDAQTMAPEAARPADSAAATEI